MESNIPKASRAWHVPAMTARYLASPFQQAILAQVREQDRGSEDFFALAPLIIDCRDDAEEFCRQVSERQRADIVGKSENGAIIYVSDLTARAYRYAHDKLSERFKALDKEARETIEAFLQDWRMEIGRQPRQNRRSRPHAFGIDIILPMGGARLSYDLSSVSGL